MDLMPFKTSFESFTSDNKIQDLFKDSSFSSLPVIVKRENELYDGIFIYSHEKKAKLSARPFAWALLNVMTGSVEMFSKCKTADFMPSEKYPWDMEVSMELPASSRRKNRTRLQKEYLSVYENIRRLAYKEGLSREDIDIIVKYKDLFSKVCYKGHYPFYYYMSPSFFSWLRLPKPEDSHLSPGADAVLPYDFTCSTGMLDMLAELKDMFADKIKTDTHKNQLFDNMHKELQDFKNGIFDNITRPLELDIIQLIDSTDKIVEAYSEKEYSAENYEALKTLVDGIKTDLTDILYRQGIDPFTVPGEEIDTLKQQIIATVITDKPKLDKKIEKRISPGWTKQGKVLRAERISAYIMRNDLGRG